MKNRGSNRGDGKLKKKKCPYFRLQTVCVCALVCACARVCVAGRATLNRTCVVCGRIHFSLVPETNPVHTNKDDVIYQRFPAVLLISSSSAAAARTVVDACTPPTHRCTITTPRHSYTLNTVIQYLYVCMYVCVPVYTTRVSVKMRSMSSALVHHLPCGFREKGIEWERADHHRTAVGLSSRQTLWLKIIAFLFVIGSPGYFFSVEPPPTQRPSLDRF